MRIPFTKMHGLGNDFILIDCRRMKLDDLPGLSRKICHRRLGIGADQVLLLYNSEKADFMMQIFNADGSQVEMCGNGIRCLAKFIWDRGLSDKDVLAVETTAGIIRPEKSGKEIRVDMGEPIFEGRLIPVKMNGTIRDFPLRISDREFKISCVSMGNPHAVTIVDDVDHFDVKKYGPLIENYELFPKRINVEFVQVIGPGEIKMRVWERGSGETMACGTGASAAAVAANLNGWTGRRVKVVLTGGELAIEWNEDNHVYMTGPAAEVFTGEISI